MFPNPYDIYSRHALAGLIPTPGSRLLARLHSGGKAHRVGDPIAPGTEGWGRTRIERLIAKGRNRPILLQDPVSVHIVYLRPGRLRRSTQFRGDHYNPDAPLVAAVSAVRE